MWDQKIKKYSVQYVNWTFVSLTPWCYCTITSLLDLPMSMIMLIQNIQTVYVNH